jgi:hypothetical protein
VAASGASACRFGLFDDSASSEQHAECSVEVGARAMTREQVADLVARESLFACLFKRVDDRVKPDHRRAVEQRVKKLQTDCVRFRA